MITKQNSENGEWVDATPIKYPASWFERLQHWLGYCSSCFICRYPPEPIRVIGEPDDPHRHAKGDGAPKCNRCGYEFSKYSINGTSYHVDCPALKTALSSHKPYSAIRELIAAAKGNDDLRELAVRAEREL